MMQEYQDMWWEYFTSTNGCPTGICSTVLDFCFPFQVSDSVSWSFTITPNTFSEEFCFSTFLHYTQFSLHTWIGLHLITLSN